MVNHSPTQNQTLAISTECVLGRDANGAWRPVNAGALQNAPTVAVMNVMNRHAPVVIDAFVHATVGVAPVAVDAGVPVAIEVDVPVQVVDANAQPVREYAFNVPQNIEIPGVGNIVVEVLALDNVVQPIVPDEPIQPDVFPDVFPDADAEVDAYIAALVAGEDVAQFMPDDFGVGLVAPLQADNFVCNLCQLGFQDVIAMRDHLDAHGVADGGAM